MNFLWNINGCIGYRDFSEAGKWLQRAYVGLFADEFAKLIVQIHENIKSDKGDLYSTSVYNIVIPYDPKLVAELILTERELSFSESFYRSLIETQSIYSDIFKELLELVKDGYNLEGYDQQGFNRDGVDKYGFDRDGFNCKGFDRRGFRRDGYNIEGYDQHGFNIENIDKDGFNRDGFNCNGFDRQGFGSDGYNIEGYDQQGFNPEGFDKDGFNRNGFDIDGYDKNGFNNIGVSRNGYISPAKWYEIIVSITHPPSYQTKWSAEESYCELNDQDQALASEWANAEKDDYFTMARMLSARTAEKIAVKFYQSLGYEVNDVSIKQPIKEENNTDE